MNLRNCLSNALLGIKNNPGIKPGEFFSKSLTLQDSIDTPLERTQLFPAGHTVNNDFVY